MGAGLRPTVLDPADRLTELHAQIHQIHGSHGTRPTDPRATRYQHPALRDMSLEEIQTFLDGSLGDVDTVLQKQVQVGPVDRGGVIDFCRRVEDRLDPLALEGVRIGQVVAISEGQPVEDPGHSGSDSSLLSK